jgi:voltage-gated potassium channel
MYKKYVWACIALLAVLAIGTVGYWLIGGKQDSFLDTLYMTAITITTVGYGEIIDLSSNPFDRVFTILVALAGIGILFYIVTNLTAFAVEGELTRSFWRRRMEKKASKAKGHYVVCGIGKVGTHIATELCETERMFTVIDVNGENIRQAMEMFPNAVFVEGDATEDNVLLKAGIENARGLFAATGDDNKNLVISLSTKELNPRARVGARCASKENIEKMKRAGADAVVLPDSIGGLRMASEMIRPTAVSFLDTMLRSGQNLRVEEVPVTTRVAGRPLSELNLKQRSDSLLLAVKKPRSWMYTPPGDYVVEDGDTLVFLTSPEERQKLERMLQTD